MTSQAETHRDRGDGPARSSHSARGSSVGSSPSPSSSPPLVGGRPRSVGRAAARSTRRHLEHRPSPVSTRPEPEVVQRAMPKVMESLFMAWMGTMMAAVLSLAAGVPRGTKYSRHGTSGVRGPPDPHLIRSVPELLLAMVLIPVTGLGAWTGTLASGSTRSAPWASSPPKSSKASTRARWRPSPVSADPGSPRSGSGYYPR
jgi:hypothetical protein